MKRTKKTLALLLTLAMVLTLFAGVAQANVDLRVGSLGVRTVPGDNRPVAEIAITAAANEWVLGAGEVGEFRIRLPLEFEWVPTTTQQVFLPTGVNATTSAVTLDPIHRRDSSFVVTSTPDAVRTLHFRGISINVPDGFRGDVNAEVRVRVSNLEGRHLWEETRTVRIATVAVAGTTSRVVRAQSIMRGAGAQQIGIIEIEEDIAGTLPIGRQIRLIAPDGVTFVDPSQVVPIIGGTAVVPLTGGAAWVGLAENGREARLMVTTTVAGRRTITIGARGDALRVNVAPGVPDGPVIVEIDNVPALASANVTRARVTVATVGVGAVTVARQGDLPDAWNLGRLNREIADIRLAETMAGALEENRTVTLTLPAGYTWHTRPVDADGAFLGTSTLSDGGRTLTYWTRSAATGSRTDFDLEDGRINARIDATPGDVVVTVGGNAGASGTAVVAVSRRPVTVTVVTTPNVRANELNQLVGNIVITENFAGALREGSLGLGILNLDLTASSVSVSDVVGSEPTARVTEPGIIWITPAIAPTNPATITISGIRGNFDLWTLVDAGAVTADVWGSSVLHTLNDTVGIAGISEPEAVGTRIANDIVVANLVGRLAARTVFTVGSTAFTVDGVAQPPLDVAPVIQDGRTMMPLRAAANAAGVTNENIFFEAGVITIIRGDRVVQFTLGSRVMVVNGVAMNMDVAPALIANRTLVPVRWVATALGVPVVWDGVAQTVTVTVN